MKNKFTISAIVLLSFVLMSGIIDLNELFNYENQETPAYLSKDNTPTDNHITDAAATLGRVLFYDKNLSVDNTTSCSSCHLQEFAFGDTAVVSHGVAGVTGRHSMRLINARYSDEFRAFWDERASSFEDQATKPIQDHVEMGYSGENGDPDFDDLIVKLEAVEHYQVLFEFVFGDTIITEQKVQKAIAQFVRSIQSYDSKYDIGRAQSANSDMDFPNFTDQENEGKQLFNLHPPSGGAGCARCHSDEEFSMIPDCDNNGVTDVVNYPDSIDLTNTKAPTLRDLVNPQGMMNGPFMHNGSLLSLMDVLDHYNDLEEVPENTNLDHRLQGTMHDLDLSQTDKEAVVAFLLTLTGEEVYTSEKLSNPFDSEGNITIVPHEFEGISNIDNVINIKPYPNPTKDKFRISLEEGTYQLFIFDKSGAKVKSSLIRSKHIEDISSLQNGVYFIQIIDITTNKIFSGKIIKE